MLKISSQGVSNLKTKGQYFLSKESYFFTLCQLGCSDTPELDWGPPGPGLGARAVVLGLLSRCCQGLEAGGASQVMGIPTSTPCTLVAHHQGVFISMEKGLQETVVAVAPYLGAPRWTTCCWGHPGGRRTPRPCQLKFFFSFCMVFFPF